MPEFETDAIVAPTITIDDAVADTAAGTFTTGYQVDLDPNAEFADLPDGNPLDSYDRGAIELSYGVNDTIKDTVSLKASALEEQTHHAGEINLYNLNSGAEVSGEGMGVNIGDTVDVTLNVGYLKTGSDKDAGVFEATEHYSFIYGAPLITIADAEADTIAGTFNTEYSVALNEGATFANAMASDSATGDAKDAAIEISYGIHGEDKVLDTA